MDPDKIRETLRKVRARLNELKKELERKEALLRAGRDVNGDGTFDEKDREAVEKVRTRRDAADARIGELELQLLRMGETDFGNDPAPSASGGSGGGGGATRASRTRPTSRGDTEDDGGRRSPSGGGTSSGNTSERGSGSHESGRGETSRAPSGDAPSIQSSLSGSVGRGGRNARNDVMTVQHLLNCAGQRLDEDGLIGPKTIGGITTFQNANQLGATGLINPGDETWQKLSNPGAASGSGAGGGAAAAGAAAAGAAGAAAEAAASAVAGAAATAGAGADPEQSAEALQEQIAETERLASLSNEELREVTLTQGDVNDLFDEDYMDTVAEFDPDYAGNTNLQTLMRELESGVSGPRVDTAMQELSAILGPPPSPEELRADYDRFLVIQRQQAANNEGDRAEALNDGWHDEFMASRGQLQFGMVIGDAFGIHEVFGSLLSPTGGLVGPGNVAFHLAPDNPVGVHGSIHDAAGYLKANHDAGPGYNYRGDPTEEIITDAIECLPEFAQGLLLPLTGQASGIAYWAGEIGEEYVESRYNAAMEVLEDGLEEVRDEAAGRINEVLMTLDAAKEDAMGLYEAAQQEVEETEEDLLQMAERAQESVREAVETVQEGVDIAAGGIRAVADEVTDGLTRAGQEMRDFSETVEDEAMGVVDALTDAAGRVGESAVEALDVMADAAGAVTDVAEEQLGALADFIWG